MVNINFGRHSPVAIQEAPKTKRSGRDGRSGEVFHRAQNPSVSAPLKVLRSGGGRPPVLHVTFRKAKGEGRLTSTCGGGHRPAEPPRSVTHGAPPGRGSVGLRGCSLSGESNILISLSPHGADTVLGNISGVLSDSPRP